jgi:hypothetical protein
MKLLFDRRELIAASFTATLLASAETPLACNLKALTAEERKAHKDRTERLFKTAKVSPIKSGYAVAFPATLWSEAALWVELERKCCPFLRFQLESAPEGQGVVMRLTGGPGVKQFLADELKLPK